jgi:hypothetical protein
MVALFITALVFFVVIGSIIYFWQKNINRESTQALPPPPEPRLLFAEQAMKSANAQESAERVARERADSLVGRAKTGDRSVLKDTVADRTLYDRLLTELILLADSGPKLLALISFVAQNDLPVSKQLAKAGVSLWLGAPERSGASKALHLAALSDEPETYQEAVEQALRLWRQGELHAVSAPELAALIDGEFWVLSSRSRSSGAGFVLKRTLAGARRELEAVTSATR